MMKTANQKTIDCENIWEAIRSVLPKVPWPFCPKVAEYLKTNSPETLESYLTSFGDIHLVTIAIEKAGYDYDTNYVIQTCRRHKSQTDELSYFGLYTTPAGSWFGLESNYYVLQPNTSGRKQKLESLLKKTKEKSTSLYNAWMTQLDREREESVIKKANLIKKFLNQTS